MNEHITDDERYPTLSARGYAMLQQLREHPAAPVYRNQSGNRLRADEVAQQHAYEAAVLNAPVGWPRGTQPEWLHDFVARTFKMVPYFRALGSPAIRFENLPTTSRANLSQDIAAFVPDDVSLERMMNFRTSGTTGHPLLIPSHPVVAGRYLAFHRRALQRVGIDLQHGAGQVGVVLLGYQRKCFTYVSVNPTLHDSGLAKINLHPNDWQHPDDRAKYLNAMSPEIYAGDPVSFSELLCLEISVKPRALISVSMTLSTALKSALSEKFSCPVLDVYSMNEAGPIACYEDAFQGHVLLQPQLYVEILDRHGQVVEEGERGEIVLTGGFNFCLPLIRYRTGDFASLKFTGAIPVLENLSGRQPVRYRIASGVWINNIDITHALSILPIPQYGVHQLADGSMTLKLPLAASVYSKAAIQILQDLFQGNRILLETINPDDKMMQYTSDLEGALL